MVKFSFSGGRHMNSRKYVNTGVKIFLVILVSFLSASCTTGHQVLKYQVPIKNVENIIPGIEPEESSEKILVIVRGKGVEPESGTEMQKKFMAERAAMLDGYRKLSERLAGMVVDARTRSGRSSLSMDEVAAETRSYLRGAQTGAVSYHDGFATVDVRVYIQPRKSRFYTTKHHY